MGQTRKSTKVKKQNEQVLTVAELCDNREEQSSTGNKEMSIGQVSAVLPRREETIRKGMLGSLPPTCAI